MGFYSKDGYYIATRITGPWHNFLGLMFSNDAVPADSVVVDVVQEERFRIDLAQIKREVMAGVESINEKYGTKYHVSGIRAFSDDSPTLGVYEYLTVCIVSRLFKISE